MTRLTSCYIIPWPDSSVRGMGMVRPPKTGTAQLAHTPDHEDHPTCMCVLWVQHIPRSGFILSSVIRLPSGSLAGFLLFFPLLFFDSLDSNTTVPGYPPQNTLWAANCCIKLSNNISCEACVLVPAAPYPTTKQRFVSMLLYASIESHCIVQLTSTKTADNE